MIVSTPKSNAEGFTMLCLLILADSVHDVGYHSKVLPKRQAAPQAAPGFFDSGVIENSEINHITGNQINIGSQCSSSRSNCLQGPY
jgi:hypothetical protein